MRTRRSEGRSRRRAGGGVSAEGAAAAAVARRRERRRGADIARKRISRNSALDVRLLTALQVLQVLRRRSGLREGVENVECTSTLYVIYTLPHTLYVLYTLPQRAGQTVGRSAAGRYEGVKGY